MRAFFILLAVLSGCVSPPVTSDEIEKEEAQAISDPLEPLNRLIFDMNTVLDHTLFFPVFFIYDLFPNPIKSAFRNVLLTVNTPISMVNALFQMEFNTFLLHTSRLLLNTVFGLGGIFDIAGSVMDINPKSLDFGQTLQKMGNIPPGCFLVLPILGPISLRDGIGRFMDCFFQPATYWHQSALIYYTASYLNIKTTYRDIQTPIEEAFDDPYVIIRGAYYQAKGDEKKENDDNDEDVLNAARSLEDADDVLSAAQSIEAQEKGDMDILDTAKILEKEEVEDQIYIQYAGNKREEGFDFSKGNMVPFEEDFMAVVGDEVLPVEQGDSDDAQNATDRLLFPTIDTP